MFDLLQERLQPVIVETIVLLIVAGFGWLMRKLPAKMQRDIEARHREALHSAVSTGVNQLIDRLRSSAVPVQIDTAIDNVLGGIHRSVPDAITALAPPRDVLIGLIKSKAAEQLIKAGLPALDDLTLRMQEAGLPATAPR